MVEEIPPTLLALLPNTPVVIPRHRQLTREGFTCAFSNTPVIIPDAAMAAHSRWSFDRLSSALAGLQLVTQRSSSSARSGDDTNDDLEVDAASFVASCAPAAPTSGTASCGMADEATTCSAEERLRGVMRRAKSNRYARIDIGQVLPAETLADVAAPACIPDPTLGSPRPERLYKLFVGPAGTTTRLDYDYSESSAWLSQVQSTPCHSSHIVSMPAQPIPSHPILFHPTPPSLIQSNPIPSDPIRSHPIPIPQLRGRKLLVLFPPSDDLAHLPATPLRCGTPPDEHEPAADRGPTGSVPASGSPAPDERTGDCHKVATGDGFIDLLAISAGGGGGSGVGDGGGAGSGNAADGGARRCVGTGGGSDGDESERQRALFVRSRAHAAVLSNCRSSRTQG